MKSRASLPVSDRKLSSALVNLVSARIASDWARAYLARASASLVGVAAPASTRIFDAFTWASRRVRLRA